MQAQLRDTIDRLFADAPQTRRTQELKEEMLQNLLDKYDDLLREGRDEQSARHAVLSGIGDVSALVESLRAEAAKDQPDAPVAPSTDKNAAPTPDAPTEPTRARFPLAALKSLTRTLGAAGLLLSPLIPLFLRDDAEEALLFVLLASGALLIFGATLRNRSKRAYPRPFAPLCAAGWAVALLGVALCCFHGGTWLPALLLPSLGFALSLAILALLDLFNRKEIFMRKTDILVRLCVWTLTTVLLFCGVLAAPTAAMADRDDDDDFYPTQTRSWTAGGATLNVEDVSAIEIDWVAGTITVKPSVDNTVTFEESAPSPIAANDALQWRLERNTLKIEFSSETMRRDSIHSAQYDAKDLTVRLPEACLSKLEIDTLEDVHVSGLLLDDLEVETVSGNALIQDVQALEVSLSTVSGSATTENVTARALDAETVSGELTLGGAFEQTEVETVSGNVSIAVQDGARRIETESTSGDVQVTLPMSMGYDAALRTTSGTMSVNAVNEADNRASAGDQTVRCQFESVSGSVAIVQE